MTTDPFAVHRHYTRQLLALINKAQAHSAKAEALLHARLSDDMFPVHQQFTTALSFVYRAINALLGTQHREQIEIAVTWSALQEAINQTLSALQTASQQGEEATDKPIALVAGFAECQFSPQDYLHLFSIPNMLFHINMAYATLRAAGVPLSKQDYDGFHRYPAGFQFA
ncbi:DUF1993 domain-containing protein [Aestuariibacter halophilus]|uniref:DUF1993 domain-containing protein n=1 Tax=Fluctibacter halophilus TaxID=226011 RepID=A0ABS8G8J2_9ALTE|nr:DUF1993 family protein [Aestuariibacter halophilus]MCC2616853.1 DUF1993 domain-containing protein [Aestuariibacter halophilus]